MHVHPFCKEVTWPNLEKVADILWGANTKIRKRLRPFLDQLAFKTSIDHYIELMDKYNIEKSVIVSWNITTAQGICIVTNDDIANLVSKYPKRLIGFGCVDVPASDAMDQLDYAIDSLCLKGIKLVPPAQRFDISDKKYDFLWKRMEDLNIPLWTHGGHILTAKGTIAKYGHPMLIDDVAMRHENLIIIIGHMGAPWFWDTYSVVLRHPNVYIDISAWPELYTYFPWDAFISYHIDHKILFASDHPLHHWNQIIPSFKKLSLPEKIKEKILSDNARKLLKSIKII